MARDATLIIIIIRDKKGRNEGEQRKELRGGNKEGEQRKELRGGKNKKNKKNQNVHVFKIVCLLSVAGCNCCCAP